MFQAAVMPLCNEQVVEVSVGGRILEVWKFSCAENRGIRRLIIPADQPTEPGGCASSDGVTNSSVFGAEGSAS